MCWYLSWLWAMFMWLGVWQTDTRDTLDKHIQTQNTHTHNTKAYVCCVECQKETLFHPKCIRKFSILQVHFSVNGVPCLPVIFSSVFGTLYDDTNSAVLVQKLCIFVDQNPERSSITLKSMCFRTSFGLNPESLWLHKLKIFFHVLFYDIKTHQLWPLVMV